MTVRVQVIMDEEEVAGFRRQAKLESSSLSRWLREAGRARLERCRAVASLRSPAALETFFARCDEREKGREPDWEDHKAVVLGGMKRGDLR